MKKREQRSNRRNFTWLFPLSIASSFYILPTNAQIVTDGSVGPQITLSGLNEEIPEALGTRFGNNLFHSFETFNIQQNGSATFTGTVEIENVISRVTGGEASVIQGLLRSEVGNADFYFVNPAGVTFSEGGSVDVPASFHLSTADELRFADNTALITANHQLSSLTMASPESFGFLTDASGRVEVINGAEILVDSGSLNIDSQTLVIRNGVVTGGENVNLNIANQLIMESSGRISNTTNGENNAGSVIVNAGELLIDGQGSGVTGISTITLGGATGGTGDIDVDVAELATINNGGIISSQTTGNSRGSAGEVRVTAGELSIDGGMISSDSIESSIGNAGTVEVVVDGLVTIVNGGFISSNTETEGVGGNVLLRANELFIIDGDISSNTSTIGSTGNGVSRVSGDAGNVEISIAGLTTFQNGFISSDTFFSTGKGGDVRVETGELLLDSANITSLSIGDGSNGDSGSVNVSVSGLATLINNSSIATDAAGMEGSSGEAGEVRVSSADLLLNNDAGISSSTSVAGSGGSVLVNISGSTIIQNGSRITSQTSDESGNAGIVRVNTGVLLLDSGSISNNSINSSRGDAGTVDVTVDGLATIRNGGRVNSQSFTAGDAGEINLIAGDLLVEGEDSEISSTTFVEGAGGAVEVTVDGLVSLQNGGVISSDTQGSGNAGEVQIAVGELSINGMNAVEFTGISSIASSLPV